MGRKQRDEEKEGREVGREVSSHSGGIRYARVVGRTDGHESVLGLCLQMSLDLVFFMWAWVLDIFLGGGLSGDAAGSLCAMR